MKIFDIIKSEIDIIFSRDPAIKLKFEALLYPSVYAILSYRLSHVLYQNSHFLLARYISQRAAKKTGIEIHPGACIGNGLFIDHGHGVVIGETVEIGNNVTIYQGVTLGGTGKDIGKRHPTIGDNVMISAGAIILGPFTIGNNVKIGAGSVVLKAVPDNCTVVGIPGKVVKNDSSTLPNKALDHASLPDPISKALKVLAKQQEEIRKQIKYLEDSYEKKVSIEEYQDAI